MPENNGWDNYKLLVLESLKDIKETQEAHGEQITSIQKEISTIQAEAKVAKYFGGIVLPAGVTLAFSWIGRKFGV